MGGFCAWLKFQRFDPWLQLDHSEMWRHSTNRWPRGPVFVSTKTEFQYFVFQISILFEMFILSCYIEVFLWFCSISTWFGPMWILGFVMANFKLHYAPIPEKIAAIFEFLTKQKMLKYRCRTLKILSIHVLQIRLHFFYMYTKI